MKPIDDPAMVMHGTMKSRTAIVVRHLPSARVPAAENRLLLKAIGIVDLRVSERSISEHRHNPIINHSS